MSSSIDEGFTSPFIRGLRGIFGGFVGRPDFSAFYESDIDQRLHKPWVRVGDSMRLALGQPVTFVTAHPDGTRTTHGIDPDPSSEEYVAAVGRAEREAQGPDEDFLAGQVVIMTTHEEAGRLTALINRSTGNVSEQG